MGVRQESAAFGSFQLILATAVPIPRWTTSVLSCLVYVREKECTIHMTEPIVLVSRARSFGLGGIYWSYTRDRWGSVSKSLRSCLVSEFSLFVRIIQMAERIGLVSHARSLGLGGFRRLSH